MSDNNDLDFSQLTIGPPDATDGVPVFDLVRRCKPLDENSIYCNLLQCSHFAGTCAAGKIGDDMLGFVSGYLPPDQPETFFLWQVAVDARARGQSLGKRLIRDILARPACRHVRFLDTTITPDNDASWGLFRSLARELEAPLEHREFFTRDAHFQGRHDTELLVHIGPFQFQSETSK